MQLSIPLEQAIQPGQRFDLEEFTFDPRTNRYRWKTGSGRGQFGSKSAVFARSRTYIQEQKDGLQQIGQRLINQEITLEQFQRDAGQRIKNIHVTEAMLGKDGLENMTPEDWLRVGRELKRHYYSGIDRDSGRRYGLSHLAREIRDGQVSDRQLLNRLSMYGEAGKVSNSEAFKALNIGVFAIRVLGATDRHCAFCIEQAAQPPRPIEEVPAIGCCPQCLGRCKCSIQVVEV